MSRIHNNWRSKKDDVHNQDHNVGPGVNAFKKSLSQRRGRRAGNRFRREYVEVYRTPMPIGGQEKGVSRPEREKPYPKWVLENTIALAFENASRAKK